MTFNHKFHSAATEPYRKPVGKFEIVGAPYGEPAGVVQTHYYYTHDEFMSAYMQAEKFAERWKLLSAFTHWTFSVVDRAIGPSA